MEKKYNNVIRLILEEKWFTITVIGSVMTFQFISAFKADLLDPFMDFILPYEKFEFMDIVVKEGLETVPQNPKLTLRIADFFKEFVKWGFIIVVLFLIGKYTTFPETEGGNSLGAAAM